MKMKSQKNFFSSEFIFFFSFENVYWEGNVVMVSQASITPEQRMHAHMQSHRSKHSHALALSYPPSLRTRDESVSHERTCTRTLSYLCASWELQDWSPEPAKIQEMGSEVSGIFGFFPGYFGIWHKIQISLLLSRKSPHIRLHSASAQSNPS